MLDLYVLLQRPFGAVGTGALWRIAFVFLLDQLGSPPRSLGLVFLGKVITPALILGPAVLEPVLPYPKST